MCWATFGSATRQLAQHVTEARTVVLFHKRRSLVVPDYAWRQTDRWIDFPWSNQPPVTDPTASGA